MKESYERTELNIIEFLQEDVILTYEQVNPLEDQPKDQYMVPIR